MEMSDLDWGDDGSSRILDSGSWMARTRALLAFLARTVHPQVQADTGLAARDADELNRILAPAGWMLRANSFISGRPVYAPLFTGRAAGPSIPLPVRDDDASKLDLILGQANHLLDVDGHGQTRDLLREATLQLRQDGGYYRPTPVPGRRGGAGNRNTRSERRHPSSCTGSASGTNTSRVTS